jgi:putative glycosyltransferase (TIGR04372 family)
MLTLKPLSLFNRIGDKVRDNGLFYTVFLLGKLIVKYFVAQLIWVPILIIKPIIFIRFGSLCANKIGPLISRPALYLAEKDNLIQPQNTVDIFIDGYGDNHHVCNDQLLKMWKRVFSNRNNILLFNGIGNWIWDSQYYLSWLPHIKKHIITLAKNGRDIYGLTEKSNIYLEFTAGELEQAILDMKRMSINENDSFVCILNRTQNYLENTFSEKNWNYHTFRNCSIQDYIPASDELTKRGHYIIRMGSIVGDLMITDNKNIIEYSNKGYRTELLDLYLCANCHFFVSCGTGLDAVPWFFKRPVVYVNFGHLEYINSWLPDCITIFKKHWLISEKRFMTVGEIIESGAGRYLVNEDYQKSGIELVDNTPSEIMDVCMEMEERLNGTWVTTEEDEVLQNKFWDLFVSSDLNGVIRSRIGSKFIKENSFLLK